MKTVWVTGIGMISGLGVGCDTTIDNALQGNSAVKPVPPERAAGLQNLLMCECPVAPETLLDKKYAGMDRATLLAMVAAQAAMQEAGLADEPMDDDRFGTYAGIGFGGAQTTESMYQRYFDAMQGNEVKRRSATVMHPLSVPRLMANSAAAAVSMRWGLRGINNTYSVACASSAIAAGEALRAIQHGYLDAAVVLGTEAMLTTGALVAWNSMRVLAKPDVHNPAHSCRPFSANRCGFVLGEGAAALVLESADRAKRRQAAPLAELAGYGCSNDASHWTLPSVEGQTRAMRQALHHAQLRTDQIDYINAHGTATEAGDVVETQSITEVFGDYAPSIPISSTKAIHGHLIGAGGAFELALSILALQRGLVPPTAHLDKPDERCNLDYVPRVARCPVRLDAVMSNSFAFGGSNAVLIAKRASA